MIILGVTGMAIPVINVIRKERGSSTFYGARCIEKHFTFDTTLNQSRDHRLSLDVSGFSKSLPRVETISPFSKKRSETETACSNKPPGLFLRSNI